MQKVTLLARTESMDELVYTAYRQCYSAESKHALDKCDPGLVEKLILKHQSPLEHVSFTFGISGVSRALTHQLVRHRVASYSHKSQRYVGEEQFGYVTPITLKDNPKYKQIMEDIACLYQELKDQGVPKEDARYILPNACETSIMATFNIRSLYNFFTLRLCNRAQWEIRDLARDMLALCREESPLLFKYAGPPCKRGKCPEGEMGC